LHLLLVLEESKETELTRLVAEEQRGIDNYTAVTNARGPDVNTASNYQGAVCYL